MADRRAVLGVLVAVEFVALSAVVLVTTPLEVAAPILPMSLLLLFALFVYLYRS